MTPKAGGRELLVARRHGLAESLLYNWCAARKAAALAAGAPDPLTFVPVGTLANPAWQDGPLLAQAAS